MQAIPLKHYAIEYARRSILGFTEYTMPLFSPTWFHESYYQKLNEFAHGNIQKLAVFMPPQHGKSEGSTRRLPAYRLGIKPDTKIGVISYSATKARKFNREIQRIIDTSEYRDVFPKTRLNEKNITTVAGQYLRNAEECEIMGYAGGFKTVGVGGPLTGDPIDMLIMDDIYKNAEDAWSQTVRDNIFDWYETVAQTRLHNDSQQLVVFTRWHHDDLAGRICTPENGWTIVKYPAIKTDFSSNLDPRNIGEALWPQRHSVERLEKIKKDSERVFSALYQQEPTPTSGSYWKESWIIPVDDEQFPTRDELTNYGTDWDLAYTSNETNSASAWVTGGTKDNILYVDNLGFDWLEFPELLKCMRKQPSPHYIEGKASGKSAKQTLTSEGINAIEVPKSSDKIVSTQLATPTAEAGRVYVRRSVLSRLLYDDRQGILKFPNGANDDLNDAFVQFILRHCTPQPVLFSYS